MDTFDKFMKLNEGTEPKNDFHKILSALLKSRDQVHYFHLQTTSFTEHKALNDYYDQILDLTDKLIETAQGQYGRVSGKIEITIEDYSADLVMKHFDETLECVLECRSNTDNGALKNIYDEIEGLIMKTKYLLTLK